jgi:hypothetical protein
LTFKVVDMADQNFMYVSTVSIQGGDVLDPTLLRREARVGIRGEEFSVRNSYEDGDLVYLRLDRDHGARVGDTVSLIEPAPEDPGAYIPMRMMPSELADRPLQEATLMDDARERVRDEKLGEFAGLTVSSNLSQVQVEAILARRPAVVLVTQPWCGASSYLVDSLNAGSEDLRVLLRTRFVVAHAVKTAGAEWQIPGNGVNETYTPRTYFMSPSGQILDVKSRDPTYPRYFKDATDLEVALHRILEVHGEAPLSRSDA